MNAILNHKFFLYGIIFLSLLTLINFYRAQSFACLGVFGIAYYLACLYMKNKGLCLLFAIAVSTIILGCEKNLEAMRNNCEGNGNDDEDCEVPVEDTFSGGMREGMESKKKKKTTPTDPNAPTSARVGGGRRARWGAAVGWAPWRRRACCPWRRWRQPPS